MTDEFTPRDILQKTLRVWWLPLLVMLIGAGAGYGFHLSRPPLFESTVTYTFSFDYARLGQLSTVDEDTAMGAAGGILFNNGLYAQLLAQVQSQGLIPPGYDLIQNVAIERKSYRWILRVRHPSAQAARQIADRWSALGSAALDDAARHAEQAFRLQVSLDGLESCLSHMAVTDPATAQCAWPNQPEVQQQATTAGQAYQAEKSAASGMVVGLSYALTENAQIPAQPVANGRNTLVLAGGLLGFVVGFLLIAAGLGDIFIKRAAHAG